MHDDLFIAVDLGAGSGRVFLVGFAPGELLLEEVRRFFYPPSITDSHLRWNIQAIFEEIKVGLRLAGERAAELNRRVHSIGVDSWAVDYGLVDTDGCLVENPICYRDPRTHRIDEQVFAKVPRTDIFQRTGIQTLPFNTIFQLYAHVQTGINPRASKLLLIPDLINLLLTGKAFAEYTNATTTQFVNVHTGTWDVDLLESLNLPEHLLPEIVPAGTEIGPLKPELEAELKLGGVKVVTPATHDTASAVAGAPLEAGWGYISSGTWSLVGVERDSPLVDVDVARHNFTNEGGAFGTFRFLKNVTGLWILESCRKVWAELGENVDYGSLLTSKNGSEINGDASALIFPDDERFLNPQNMVDALAQQISENGQKARTDPATLTRTILDSLALRYASVVKTIESLINRKLSGIQIVGGGSRNEYLNRASAAATNLTVVAGPVEATVIGNASVQAVSAGRFRSLAEARRHVREHTDLPRFEPEDRPIWEMKSRRYSAIEGRYV